MISRRSARIAMGAVLSTVLIAPLAQASPQVAPAPAPPQDPPKSAEAVGYGGAVSSVDANATNAGMQVLRNGGTAADAAVATAAALGVTEPFSSGVGGGGYFVYYNAKTGKVETIDGRETAPASARPDMFLGPDGKPIPEKEAFTSGLATGVPSTPKTWEKVLQHYGTKNFNEVLAPAQKLADEGFVVDQQFYNQINKKNKERFSKFTSTRDLFLPENGQPPAVGSTFKNRDLAKVYADFRKDNSAQSLYHGPLGDKVAATVNEPPLVAPDPTVRPGQMTKEDISAYDTVDGQAPTKMNYKGYEVNGMAPSSSGGTTVGQGLNMMESIAPRQGAKPNEKVPYLHRFIESSRYSFADRNKWVGDPKFTNNPTQELLSEEHANSRACLVKTEEAAAGPVAAGDPRNPQPCAQAPAPQPSVHEGPNTTHLVTADKYGNVASYTLTIEQEGGNGIVVPGTGFLLNNELTDFTMKPKDGDPNLPAPGKRPRSSMSPTIVLKDGKPIGAVGSPGGATIITTVLQVLTGRVERGQALVDAIAEPRVSQRNPETGLTEMEPEFLGSLTPQERHALEAMGHRFNQDPEKVAEIGAAVGLEFQDGKVIAAAERVRRGGGHAAVEIPVGGLAPRGSFGG